MPVIDSEIVKQQRISELPALEAKNSWNPVYAPEKIDISKPPENLTSAKVQAHLRDLEQQQPDRYKEVIRGHESLLFEVLMMTDELGRPYPVDIPSLRAILNAVDTKHPNKWLQSGTFTRAIHGLYNRLNSGLRDDRSSQYYQNRVKEHIEHHHGFYKDGSYSLATFIHFGGPRFENANQPDRYVTMFNGRAQDAEKLRRLSPLLPPRDPDEWYGYISETISTPHIVHPESVSTLHDAEIQAGGELFVELEDIYGITDDEKRHDNLLICVDMRDLPFYITLENSSIHRHSGIPGETIKYDISKDLPDRYHFCLQIARMCQLTPDQQPKELAAWVSTLVELITEDPKQLDDRLQDVIEWVAYEGGDDDVPSWFFKAHENRVSESPTVALVQSGERPIYQYFTEQFPIKPNRSIYYLENIQALPNPEDPEFTKIIQMMLENNKLRFLPLTNIEVLNETLNDIFTNPTDNTHVGETTANALPKLAQYDWDTIITRSPSINELHKIPPWTRKFIASKRRVGICGVAKKINGDEILIITPLFKKDVRRSD